MQVYFSPNTDASEELAARMEGLRCTACDSVEAGVRQALDAASRIPGCILYIGGSTFVVAEAVGLFDPLKNTAQ